MTRLMYCNLEHLNLTDVDSLVKNLPRFMHVELKTIRNVAYRMPKILARLMISKIMYREGKQDLMDQWKTDIHCKPYIPFWYNFNISHSEHLVVLAYGNQQVGVDVEKSREIDFLELLEYLHPKEQNYITSANDLRLAFYTIWVNKEAFLKAIGIGIIKGLNQFDCSGASVLYLSRKWFFKEIIIHNEYVAYVCHPEAFGAIVIDKFLLSTNKNA